MLESWRSSCIVSMQPSAKGDPADNVIAKRQTESVKGQP